MVKLTHICFDLVPYGMVWFGFVWYDIWVLSRYTAMQNFRLLAWKKTELWPFLSYLVWYDLVCFDFVWMLCGYCLDVLVCKISRSYIEQGLKSLNTSASSILPIKNIKYLSAILYLFERSVDNTLAYLSERSIDNTLAQANQQFVWKISW